MSIDTSDDILNIDYCRNKKDIEHRIELLENVPGGPLDTIVKNTISELRARLEKISD